jgi:hypothetical protein
MVASLQCRCHLETATIKHRIERNDDQIEPFFDSIGQKLTQTATLATLLLTQSRLLSGYCLSSTLQNRRKLSLSFTTSR